MVARNDRRQSRLPADTSEKSVLLAVFGRVTPAISSIFLPTNTPAIPTHDARHGWPAYTLFECPVRNNPM
jgi:hypothetical protein